jgi:predicted RND superfamily exporter protein
LTRLIAALVDTAIRRRGIVLGVTALVVAGSIALALRLRLVTDLGELLPTDDPAVVATQQIQRRLGNVTALQIQIASPDRAANLRYAETIASALGREPMAVVERVAYHVRAEREYFATHWWLYLDAAELELVRDRLVREVRWRKNPLLVEIDDDAEALDALEARLRAKGKALDRFPDATFMSPDGTLVVVLAWPPEPVFHEHAGEALVARVEQLVREHRPATFHPQMRVVLGGYYDGIEERRALESDLAWASIACLVLVSLVVALFFGRLRAVPLMAAPGLCGVAVAFAVGELAFGQLNASTAFLGSIILGSGINGAIVQLARCDEERRAGAELVAAIRTSVLATMRGTATAALAAAIAYGSLSLTSFRGFSQFGVIGALGMVASWLATIVVLPALVATFDRRDLARARRGFAFGAPFAAIATRAPRAVAIAGVLVTVGALAALVPDLRDPFEYDLRRLRSVQGEARKELGRRVDAIFGSLTPAILLAETPAQAEEVAAIVRERAARTPGVIGDVRTIANVRPARVEDKRVLIAEIRTLVAEALPELEGDDRDRLARWLPPESFGDVPDSLVRPFRGVTGEPAPAVIVLRAPELSFWNGRDLVRLAELIRTVTLADGTVVHAGGSSLVFAGMIESIARDGPLATLVSLAGVALLVIVLVRSRGAVVVLASLVTGVIWMAGAAALAGVRVNFLNFIVLPLTFGIGVDYAVNVYLRARGDIARALRATGGAVALCSLTTTIGYASLLVADSQGLRSFGALAILGELACMLAALLVMPAWLLSRTGSRSRAREPTRSRGHG